MDRDNEVSIICPVRKAAKKENEKIAEFVDRLIRNGFNVYWPTKDNPFQNTDKVGLKICKYNAKRFLRAKDNWIWWNDKSKGSHFDLGMMFMLMLLGEMLENFEELTLDELAKLLKDRKIILANPKEVQPTENKSFNNLLLKLNRLALGR